MPLILVTCLHTTLSQRERHGCRIPHNCRTARTLVCAQSTRSAILISIGIRSLTISFPPIYSLPAICTTRPLNLNPARPQQMSESREDSVYLAKLAEQAERYEGELMMRLCLIRSIAFYSITIDTR